MSNNYELPENMTIKEVVQIKENFQQLLSSYSEKNLVVDGNNVQEIDASGVQLILSLYKSILSRNIEFELVNPSDKLKWALEVSGAHEII